MLGQAYLMKKSYGMAKAHLKRVLELNPNHSVAQKYSQVLAKRIAEKQKAASQVAQPVAKAKKGKVASQTTQPTTKPKPKQQSWFKKILGR
jgi:uncharacterized protein HemY